MDDAIPNPAVTDVPFMMDDFHGMPWEPGNLAIRKLAMALV